MLKLGTLRWRGRCKRHPRYDPAEGEGAIKGGCQSCLQLLVIYHQHIGLIEMIRAFGPVRQRKKKKSHRPSDDERQVSLFEEFDP